MLIFPSDTPTYKTLTKTIDNLLARKPSETPTGVDLRIEAARKLMLIRAQYHVCELERYNVRFRHEF